jgi:hypothetical protein
MRTVLHCSVRAGLQTPIPVRTGLQTRPTDAHHKPTPQLGLICRSVGRARPSDGRRRASPVHRVVGEVNITPAEPEALRSMAPQRGRVAADPSTKSVYHFRKMNLSIVIVQLSIVIPLTTAVPLDDH